MAWPRGGRWTGDSRPCAFWSAAWRRLRLGALVLPLLLNVGPIALAADPCPEPSDTWDQACPLADGATVTGWIETRDDIDAYRVDLPASRKLRAELTNLDADFDLFLTDLNGNVLRQSNQEGTTAEAVELNVTEAGTYFLFVTIDPARPHDPTAAYTLRVTYPAGPVRAAGSPPELGAPLFSDSLSQPGLASAFTCATQAGSRQFGTDGYALRIAGRCASGDTYLSIGDRWSRVTYADGGAELEFLPTQGFDRARIALGYRVQVTSGNNYAAQIEPGRGLAQIGRNLTRQWTTLSQRNDLAGLVQPGEWNSLAVRTVGSRHWLFVNGQAALSATDTSFDSGQVSVSLARTGNIDDVDEVGAVFRNFRISGLADDEGGRPSAVLAPGTPRVPRIYFTLDSDPSRRFTSDRGVLPGSTGTIFAFYDYNDIRAPNTVRGYLLVNDSTDGAPPASPPSTPANPNGTLRTSIDWAGRGPGKLTMVVEVNGQAVVRGDLELQ